MNKGSILNVVIVFALFASVVGLISSNQELINRPVQIVNVEVQVTKIVTVEVPVVVTATPLPDPSVTLTDTATGYSYPLGLGENNTLNDRGLIAGLMHVAGQGFPDTEAFVIGEGGLNLKVVVDRSQIDNQVTITNGGNHKYGGKCPTTCYFKVNWAGGVFYLEITPTETTPTLEGRAVVIRLPYEK